jgi:hypothetical protein
MVESATLCLWPKAAEQSACLGINDRASSLASDRRNCLAGCPDSFTVGRYLHQAVVALGDLELVAVATQVSLDLWTNERLVSAAGFVAAGRFARSILQLDLCYF